MNLNHFSDLPKPIALIGLGVSGQAIYDLLLVDGVAKSALLLYDEKSPEAQFKSYLELMNKERPKTLIVSPGVPLQSEWIQEAVSKGCLITSELSLAYRYLTTEKIISITGSVGKSTTTCLLQAALEKLTFPFFVGGNLGTPLAIYAKELAQGKRVKAEWLVLELSSYQLENFNELISEYSIITYFTANHLERYKSKNDYYQTKWDLEKRTIKSIVLNSSGGELKFWSLNQKAHTKWTWTDRFTSLINKYNLSECQLLGAHNQDNIALAASIIHLAQWPETAYKGLREFRGLPHRVENVGTFNGLRFINDSKSTTIESVKIALLSTLETVSIDHKLHLLLGGRDKNLPWEELGEFKNNPQIKFYFFGECRNTAKIKSDLPGEVFTSMIEAVKNSTQHAQRGDSILLSPGGTSLDEFSNFEVRGQVFKDFVTHISSDLSKTN